VADPDCDNHRRWCWLRVVGAHPAEAVYLASAHPEVHPGRPQDIPTAADLLAQYRADRQPQR
jgi:predicted urease superfamily metal-dependent hydrolase